MCKLVRGREFDACDGKVSRDHFVSRCVDASCACLARGASSSQCRCEALSSFVSECLSAPVEIGSKLVDLPAWRSIHDCPALCEPPFVYNDCFKNECEVSCENVRQTEPCPRVKDGAVCVSGCFCPEGLVRDGNNCVPAARCRDCACHGLGSGSSYVSFDGVNVRFEPNCTHLLSRDNAPNFDIRLGEHLAEKSNEDSGVRHTYQVWVSNGPCPQGLCAEALTILYEWHVIQVKKGQVPDMLYGSVDGIEITQLPYSNGWLTIEESPIRDVHIVIPTIQMELVIFRHNFAFVLRLPSTLFSGSMDGICGDCNGEQRDEMKMPNGEVTTDSQKFGNSWQVSDSVLTEFDNIGINCRLRGTKQTHSKIIVDVSTCLKASIVGEGQRCEQLLRGSEFSRCHGLIDPGPYYSACRTALCSGRDACDEIHAYASLCSSKAGICLPWRTPNLCPISCTSPLEYRACESSCPKTCESITGSLPSQSETISASFIKCKESEGSAIQEGCFCPEDRVWLNGSCVLASECTPPPTPSPICDDQGHIEGDTWMSDNCTKCNCLSGGRVECERETCSAVETICEQNFKAILVTGTEIQCCPKYICVPDETASSLCNEAQQPECGFGQSLKTSVDSNGCQNFICQCVSDEECQHLVGNETVSETGLLEPGYVMTLNNSGCCPRYTKSCQPDTCPTPPSCQQFYNPILKTDSSSCCPKIVCEAPSNLCLISSSLDHNVIEEQTLAKKIGETWEEGKCKTCVCTDRGNGSLPLPICSIKECLSSADHPDSRDYVLKTIESKEQCCPIFERVACKEEDKIYQVGDKWHPAGVSDACAQTECILDDQNVISKRNLVQQCDQTCAPGYEYQLPQSSNDQNKVKCCGECVAYACNVEALEVDANSKENETRLIPIGHSWRSLKDPCLNNLCTSIDGSVQIHSTKEICDDVSSLELSDYQLEKQAVNNQCCLKIIRTACLSEGKYYQPGEQWQSPTDSCIMGSCLKTDDGSVLKHVEMKTCNVDCPWGWEYQRPNNGTCCGECKQSHCILDGVLYNPGQTWQSSDSCTTYSCDRIDDQLLLSTSSPVCPELDCSPELVYSDGCCKRCKIVSANKTEIPPCGTEVIDFDSTIGLVVIKDGPHGSCKNLQPVLGLTECRGTCDSSTHFDSITWKQSMNCKCCQPVKYRNVKAMLTCDDGEIFNQTLSVPEVCSCQSCSSQDSDADSSSTDSEPNTTPRKWLIFG
ncbi:hypothetical protein QAD02_019049 [Eretmocerus hayati]|uniref:Uncharacterized protein n=1 Tax=Eretmocerus hayati TaxID=131215 RepID=A0ACC2PIR0_9HYME|nr:hypothetical protein QAD02_019049 [Eretmocerus hayati]